MTKQFWRVRPPRRTGSGNLREYAQTLDGLRSQFRQSPESSKVLSSITLEQLSKAKDPEFREAMVGFTNEVVEQVGETADALVSRAVILLAFDRETDAAADLVKAVEVEPDNAQLHNRPLLLRLGTKLPSVAR